MAGAPGALQDGAAQSGCWRALRHRPAPPCPSHCDSPPKQLRFPLLASPFPHTGGGTAPPSDAAKTGGGTGPRLGESRTTLGRPRPARCRAHEELPRPPPCSRALPPPGAPFHVLEAGPGAERNGVEAGNARGGGRHLDGAAGAELQAATKWWTRCTGLSCHRRLTGPWWFPTL